MYILSSYFELQNLTCALIVLLGACRVSTVYLRDRIQSVSDISPDKDSWLDYAETWVAMLDLRSEMECKRGQAILDCMCLDESVLRGLGRGDCLFFKFFLPLQ